jgi:glycosyltransferase involved in cell wall biosynthesis
MNTNGFLIKFLLEMKWKIGYLVTERGCLVPGSGAHQHISVGINELSRYFDIVRLFDSPEDHKNSPLQSPKRLKPPWHKRTYLWGTLRDGHALVRQVFTFPQFFLKVKRQKINAIYERSAFLSFHGFWLSKLAGLPHFIENNGLKYYEFRENRSLFQPFYEYWEKRVYKSASHVFFVGTWGVLADLRTGNWSHVENGVEKELLEYHLNAPTAPNDRSLRLAMIAKVMPHHNLGVLAKALNDYKGNLPVALTLIGQGFEHFVSEVNNSNVQIIEAGILPRSKALRLLATSHCGIVTCAEPFPSHMKLLDYAAVGLQAIVPKTNCLNHYYNAEVVSFYHPSSSSELLEIIRTCAENADSCKAKGKKLQLFVKQNYTWEKIFEAKSSVMKAILEK